MRDAVRQECLEAFREALLDFTIQKVDFGYSWLRHVVVAGLQLSATPGISPEKVSLCNLMN